MQVTPTRFQAQGADGTVRQFAIDSQVMDYVEPARAFGLGDLAATPDAHFQPRLLALPDRSAGSTAPMVLSLDRQRRLVLVRRGGAGSTGWQRTDLSAQLATFAPGPVTAFGAAWSEQAGGDRATFAVAVQTDAGSRVLIAYDVDLGNADWASLPWQDYGARAGLAVSAIRVWRGAQGVWLTMLSGSAGFGQEPYLIRSDRPRTLDHAIVFSAAADLAHILDLQAGAWRISLPGEEQPSDSILYVLGTNRNGGRALFGRPVEFDAAGQPQVTATYALRAPDGANVLALGRDSGKGLGADLYIGGNGVTRIAARSVLFDVAAKQETVIPSTLPSPVRRLLVSENGAGAASVWALLEDGQLFAVRRTAAAGAWSTPVAIRSGVADIASGAPGGELTGSILVVYEDGPGTNLWRDANGIWQEAVLVTADPGDATKIASLATQLTVLDEDGLPQPGVPVTLRTSLPTSLVINGQHYYVGPTTPVTVDTAANGGLAIFNRALSFAPAIYRFALAGMDRCLDVNPAAALYERFSRLTADELRSATVPDSGEPLLAAEHRNGSGNGSIDALVDTLRTAAQLGLGGQNGGGAVPGVRLVAPDARFLSAISAAALPPDYRFGLAQDAGGGLAKLETAPAGGSGTVLDWLGDSISDFLEAVSNGIKAAAGFVVRVAGKVVEVVCSIGQAVKTFVLESLEHIGAFFEWAWDALSSAAGKVWDYVKFLFDWDDIIGVRNRLANMIEGDLQELSAQVGSLRNRVGAAFDGTLQAIRAKGEEFGVAPSRALATQPPAASLKKSAAVRDNAAGDTMSSGPGAWVMDQLEKLGRELITYELPPGADAVPSGNLVDDLQHTFAALCEQLGEDARTIFGTDFRLLDLDADKIRRLVVAVTFRIAEGATLAVKAIVVRTIEALQGMIDLFRNVMYAKIRLPFLEKLLKLVGAGDVDTSFRLIDLMLLAPAVLTTVTYKLVVRDVPLKDVLASPLAPAGAVTAQSLPHQNEQDFIRHVAGTYIGFAAVMLDSGKAAVPVPVQEGPGKVGWLFWGLGFVSHAVGNRPKDDPRKPVTTAECETAMYGVGLLQSLTKAYRMKADMALTPAAFLDMAGVYAVFDLVCYTLQLALKSVAFAADDPDRRDTLEFVQFSARTGAQALNQVARLTPEVATKETLVVISMAGNFLLNLAPGLYRSATALGKTYPAPQPVQLTA